MRWILGAVLCWWWWVVLCTADNAVVNQHVLLEIHTTVYNIPDDDDNNNNNDHAAVFSLTLDHHHHHHQHIDPAAAAADGETITPLAAQRLPLHHRQSHVVTTHAVAPHQTIVCALWQDEDVLLTRQIIVVDTPSDTVRTVVQLQGYAVRSGDSPSRPWNYYYYQYYYYTRMITILLGALLLWFVVVVAITLGWPQQPYHHHRHHDWVEQAAWVEREQEDKEQQPQQQQQQQQQQQEEYHSDESESHSSSQAEQPEAQGLDGDEWLEIEESSESDQETDPAWNQFHVDNLPVLPRRYAEEDDQESSDPSLTGPAAPPVVERHVPRPVDGATTFAEEMERFSRLQLGSPPSQSRTGRREIHLSPLPHWQRAESSLSDGVAVEGAVEAEDDDSSSPPTESPKESTVRGTSEQEMPVPPPLPVTTHSPLPTTQHPTAHDTQASSVPPSTTVKTPVTPQEQQQSNDAPMHKSTNETAVPLPPSQCPTEHAPMNESTVQTQLLSPWDHPPADATDDSPLHPAPPSPKPPTDHVTMQVEIPPPPEGATTMGTVKTPWHAAPVNNSTAATPPPAHAPNDKSDTHPRVVVGTLANNEETEESSVAGVANLSQPSEAPSSREKQLSVQSPLTQGHVVILPEMIAPMHEQIRRDTKVTLPSADGEKDQTTIFADQAVAAEHDRGKKASQSDVTVTSDDEIPKETFDEKAATAKEKAPRIAADPIMAMQEVVADSSAGLFPQTLASEKQSMDLAQKSSKDDKETVAHQRLTSPHKDDKERTSPASGSSSHRVEKTPKSSHKPVAESRQVTLKEVSIMPRKTTTGAKTDLKDWHDKRGEVGDSASFSYVSTLSPDSRDSVSTFSQVRPKDLATAEYDTKPPSPPRQEDVVEVAERETFVAKPENPEETDDGKATSSVPDGSSKIRPEMVLSHSLRNAADAVEAPMWQFSSEEALKPVERKRRRKSKDRSKEKSSQKRAPFMSPQSSTRGGIKRKWIDLTDFKTPPLQEPGKRPSRQRASDSSGAQRPHEAPQMDVEDTPAVAIDDDPTTAWLDSKKSTARRSTFRGKLSLLEEKTPVW